MMELPKTEIPALRTGDAPLRIEVPEEARASVLIVDDNPAKLTSLAAIVSGMRLKVMTAASGREALRHLLLHDFALILLDVIMPTLDGYETAHLIHSRPRSAHVPIIFTTAEALTEEDRFRGYTTGAVDWILWPITPEILQAKIKVFVDLFYLNYIVRQEARQRREAEEALRVSNEEIAAKNVQLENVSRMKSEFLANMSHELRTPLNAIIGFSEMLKDGLLGKLSAKQKGYITDIFNSGEHLLSLINDILDLSKVEAGKMALETEPLEIAGLLQNSLRVVKEKALKHRIAIKLDLAGSPDHIVADARKVKQIVYNLLSNAMKFTPDGGQMEISARAVTRDALALIAPEGIAVRQLPLPANEWRDFLEIKVCDSGIGIAAADLDRLFQAFQQLDSSLERNFEGTGLGLALVKRMAALHGGTVAVASAPGKGSCFAVWLPCRTGADVGAGLPANLQPAATAASNAVTPDAKRVLVIEDDDKAAQILRLYLESASFCVAYAPDAESGLEMAVRERPDLVTLDLLLPGMGGWEVLEHLKADPALAGVPVVIVTIVDVPSRAGFVLGAAKVLQKPVRRETLLGALRELGLGGKARRKFTVLAVDDDPKALELIAASLAGEKNCALLRASSGQEAINSVRQAAPDLMILDLMMPGVSGFDVVDALKNDPATAAMPILILTAKTVSETDRKRLNGHVLKIMEKSSFDRERFLAEVQRAIGG